MGTDLYLQIEVRIDGKWNWIGKYLPNFINKNNYFPIIIYRSYEFFSIIAGVRNHFGIIPITKPRGLPKDIDPVLLKEYNEYTGNILTGEHTFSWLTIKEIEDFDWNRKLKRKDYVNPQQYKEFLLIGKPITYSGIGRARVKGENGKWKLIEKSGKWEIKRISNDEMNNLINGKMDIEKNIKYLTEIEWEITYIQAVENSYYSDLMRLFNNVIDLHAEEEKYITKNDVRIVFGFSS